MVVERSYPYNVNPWTGKTASLYQGATWVLLAPWLKPTFCRSLMAWGILKRIYLTKFVPSPLSCLILEAIFDVDIIIKLKLLTISFWWPINESQLKKSCSKCMCAGRLFTKITRCEIMSGNRCGEYTLFGICPSLHNDLHGIPFR